MVPFCQENRLATRLLVSKLAHPKMETLTNKEDPILSARGLHLEVQWLWFKGLDLKLRGSLRFQTHCKHCGVSFYPLCLVLVYQGKTSHHD